MDISNISMSRNLHHKSQENPTQNQNVKTQTNTPKKITQNQIPKLPDKIESFSISSIWTHVLAPAKKIRRPAHTPPIYQSLEKPLRSNRRGRGTQRIDILRFLSKKNISLLVLQYWSQYMLHTLDKEKDSSRLELEKDKRGVVSIKIVQRTPPTN